MSMPVLATSTKEVIGIHELSSPGQNGRHFADDIFKCNFLNENARIPNKFR